MTVVVLILPDAVPVAEPFDDFSAKIPAPGVGRRVGKLDEMGNVKNADGEGVFVAVTDRLVGLDAVVSRGKGVLDDRTLELVGSVRKNVDVEVDVATTASVEESVIVESKGETTAGDAVVDSVKKNVDVDVEVATTGGETSEAGVVVGKPNKSVNEEDDAMTSEVVIGAKGIVTFKTPPVEV